MGKRHLGALFFGLLVLLGLYFSSLYDYLLFHSLAEMFSVIIAFCIFIIVWNSREYFDNNYLLFIGIAYLFVGGVDIAHTLGYRGMGVFKGYNSNLPTQLWIAARYMEGLSLLIAFWFFRRRLRPHLVFLGYAVVLFLLLMSIFWWNIFPVCFVEGTGLTPFKKISEYVISFILLASIAFLFRNRKEFDRTVLQWVTWSIVFTIASELAFTFYVDVYGLSNLIGHYLKILSFYFIYKGVIQTGLQKPYDVMFRKIKLSEERYRSLFTNMSNGFAYHRVVVEGDRGQPVDYVFLEMNDAFEKLTGLKREKLIGKRVTEVLPGIRNDSTDWIGKYGKVAMGGEAIRFENYSEALGRWYSVLAYCPERNHFVTVFEDVTDRKHAEEALRQRTLELQRLTETLEQQVQERTEELEAVNEELRNEIDVCQRVETELKKSESDLRQLSVELLNAQEKERKLVAGEIHDSIGSSLSAIKFKVENALTEVVDKSSETTTALQSVIPIVQGAIDEARRIQMNLRPSLLDDLGILATIKWFCRQFESTYSRIQISQSIEIEEHEVPDSLKTVIFRVLQEGLNNAAKHSKAHVVLLSLGKTDQATKLVIRDRGQGFDLLGLQSPNVTARGLGLKNMRERIELSGGSFDIESTVGEGTTIRASWPLSKKG